MGLSVELWIYQFSEYICAGRMLFILSSKNVSVAQGSDWNMSYSIEIELPKSGNWFRYFTNVDSLEEAESIKKAAEGTVKARILKN